MYDGYYIGNLEIYNPWSIVNYANRKKLNPYWVNTSANTMIKNAMSQCDMSIANFQFMAGYLTIDHQIKMNRYWIRIPNQEVQEEFKALTAYHLKVSDEVLDDIFYALEILDFNTFKEKYQNILMTLPSSHDLKDENSYHMLILGLCAWLNNDYEIKSNRETGKGKCDIILKAKRQSAIIYF